MNKVLTKYVFLALVLLTGGAATAQSSGVQVDGRVFGGGNLAAVNGNTRVTINQVGAVVTGDVYGGGALADVGTMATGETNATTHIVTVTQGTVNGDIYGGGLGQKEVAEVTNPETGEVITPAVPGIAAAVNGKVTVNIGTGTADPDTHFATSVTGNATIGGNVFGCNNANGTPKDNVTVNIFKTAHTTENEAAYQGNDSTFAIAQVFGGGNKAHYLPASVGKKTTVHVWTCDNTIEYLYGGGNAADVGTNDANGYESADTVIIDGGRIGWVFGGGNGAGVGNPGANIYGDASVAYRGGDIVYLFGGSNTKGNISGTKTVKVLSDLNCSAYNNHIASLYGGSNEAPLTGGSGINLSMACPPEEAYPCQIDSIFGGSRNAIVEGDVTLTIAGGLYDYVFGGNNIGGEITGNVTLNLFGGTIDEAAFGGNNKGGVIKGSITVNMFDQGDCPLIVHNIYGGGRLAEYNPTVEDAHPEVNLINGTVSMKNIGSVETPVWTGGNVFGGGYGSGATVTTNTEVNVGYDNASMATLVTSLLPTGTPLTIADVDVEGDVYGGGELAAVVGGTTVTIQKESITGLTAGTDVTGDVYGGGALANTGGANVTLNGGSVHDIYGGGLGDNDHAPVVSDAVQVTVNGGTVTGSVYGCNNASGAPTGTVNVDIYGTDVPDSGYALGHVFGGGNQAAYGGTPVVKIHNCNNSIEYVYGGGNKASVVSTDVKVYGGNTIGYVFGGGNGEGVATDYTMVSGNVSANIYGGTIDKVFGGNNSSGTITGTISVNVNKEPEVVSGNACNMKIGEVYGGGNLATGNAGAISIGCTGTWTTSHDGHNDTDNRIGYELEGIGTVYGGANKAGINSAITLNINSGIVENVFGGNNTSGEIDGDIVVNIEKDDDVSCDWYVGDVYGGGNHAPYGRTPDVNIIAGTVSGSVFGGGNEAGVGGGDVTMTGGNVLGGLYGGCNTSGNVGGDITVSVTGGTIGADGNPASVYGGGYGGYDDNAHPGTSTSGDVEVTINGASAVIWGDVYGGSAKGSVNTDENNETNVTLTSGTVHGDLYGGGLGDSGYAAAVNGAVQVTVNGGTVTNVFGCNNVNGAPQDTVGVAINNGNITNDVYGGGNFAAYDANIVGVTISGGTVNGRVFGGGNNITSDDPNNNIYKGVLGSFVEMTGGEVKGSVYGGCNEKGTVVNNAVVNVIGGTIGDQTLLNGGTTADVYGGGLGENTRVNGNVTVTISRATGTNPPDAPTIYGDVYGGSALGSVNTDGNNTTTVNIMYGTLVTKRTSETLANGQTVYYYTGGNVYGGGLGRKAVGQVGDPGYVAPIAAEVKGVVTVNIGSGTVQTSGEYAGYTTTPNTGNATIGGNVYGCNNANGSPEQDVTVNIFKTAHTPDNEFENGTGYAIANVFGGGNEADYTASGMTASVNVYGCDNTIERSFGGGNAAAAPHVATFIQGGRFAQVFGGGNGERGSSYGADITNGIELTIHGGNVGQFFGGSNQNGVVTGSLSTTVDNNGPCGGDLTITEFFCGGNFVNINGDLETSITCSDGMTVTSLYGGCNMANITGHVVLNLYGGNYTNVYGGSKGDLASLGSGHIDKQANIGGYVTLNLYGGTIENAFGGSNINGNINGTITVNVIDDEGDCPLYITNIYGGSNMTNYTPTYTPVAPETERISPVVNVVHAKYGISGNVYGGSKGVESATVTLTANPLVNIGYDASLNVYIPSTGANAYTVPASPRAIVAGSVFGGGDAAKVQGNTAIFLRNKAKVFGNVYGGGNMGEVTGDTKVIVNGADQ